MEFYGYRKCTTCRNAHQYLKQLGIDVPFHDFVAEPPSPDQLRDWVRRLGQGIAPLLNTKGRHFRELGLAPEDLDESAWIERLSQDGRLLKRPVLVTDDDIIIGFDKTAYERLAEARK
jgi:arsenate reductase